MCLNYKQFTPTPLVARKDIPVFVVRYTDLSGIQSPFNPCYWKIGEVKEVHACDFVDESQFGFHSYATSRDAEDLLAMMPSCDIFEATIPAGSQYVIGSTAGVGAVNHSNGEMDGHTGMISKKLILVRKRE